MKYTTHKTIINMGRYKKILTTLIYLLITLETNMASMQRIIEIIMLGKMKPKTMLEVSILACNANAVVIKTENIIINIR
jgi:hypothetical protein